MLQCFPRQATTGLPWGKKPENISVGGGRFRLTEGHAGEYFRYTRNTHSLRNVTKVLYLSIHTGDRQGPFLSGEPNAPRIPNAKAPEWQVRRIIADQENCSAGRTAC